jgi:hypothetical protein
MKLLFTLVLIVGAAVLGYVFLPSLLEQTSERSPQIIRDESFEVRTTSQTLMEGFRRATTLGLAPGSLSYGTGGPHDLAGGLNLLPRPAPAFGTGNTSGKWALGGGQLVGPYLVSAPDLAFYLTPIALATCQRINRELWGSSDSTPVLSGVPLADWPARRANLLEVFGGKNRTEACIQTAEGEYLYYRMVYGTTEKKY